MKNGGKNKSVAFIFLFSVYIYIYIYIYMYTVSHKSEYTPHISATILVYPLKGQYYSNETWIYFRVVNVQLV